MLTPEIESADDLGSGSATISMLEYSARNI
jgi:hypothetical protein